MQELFKQAAAIAQVVPESMHEAAFNRALDLLTGGSPAAGHNGGKKANRKPNTKVKDEVSSRQSQANNDLLDAIDSTQHPEVRTAATTLDRALMILQIALDEHDIDGLAAHEIATILTDKFRISTKANTVTVMLGRSTHLVNRVTRGRGFAYRIMGPGTDYLAHKDDPESASRIPANGQKKRRKKHTDKKPGTEKESQDETAGKAKSRGSYSGRPGPGAMVQRLIQEGFFKEAKSLGQIIEHCQLSLGYTYKLTDLSTTMTRALRNGSLKRRYNAEQQFEYYTT